MNNQTQNPLQILRILWGALLMGQIIVLVVTNVIETKSEALNLGNLTLIIVVLGIMLGVLGKFIVFPKLLKINLKNKEINGMMAYRNAFIVSCAIIEGGNLMMILFYFLTKNPAFLIGIFIGLLLFLSQIPMPDTITSQIEKAKKQP